MKHERSSSREKTCADSTDHVSASLDGALAAELQQTLDTSATGITRCSRDLRYLLVNAAYAKLVGLTVDQIIGRPIIDVMGNEAFEVNRPYVDRVLRGERVEYEE